MHLSHGRIIITAEDHPWTVKRAVGASIPLYNQDRLPGVTGDWPKQVLDTEGDLRSGFGFGRTLDPNGMARPDGTATLYVPPREVALLLTAYRDHTLADPEFLPDGVQIEEETLAVNSLLQRVNEITGT